jgi:hypothetical protein
MRAVRAEFKKAAYEPGFVLPLALEDGFEQRAAGYLAAISHSHLRGVKC